MGDGREDAEESGATSRGGQSSETFHASQLDYSTAPPRENRERTAVPGIGWIRLSRYVVM